MRSGLIRRYYYDRLDLVAGYDASNNLLVTATFAPGIDQPISLAIDGEVYHYHADALGSVYQMTDSDQAVAKSYDYSAFGKIVSETGSVLNPFTYTAREFDLDSGLYYYRARYYDAGVGRFLSRDSVESSLSAITLNNDNYLSITDASSEFAFYIYLLGDLKHSYLYVSGNPINASDPMGFGLMDCYLCWYYRKYCDPDQCRKLCSCKEDALEFEECMDKCQKMGNEPCKEMAEHCAKCFLKPPKPSS
jgi:RHS repeat-associated protein